ncbi:hypothetical protein OBBRIDRAFT_405793 [Obba rivulosa]|uniref:F-box domain-containing protein n=1 Tax=Obba rivulosa TaxID=1052685 RepID=A0A8E2B2Y3_9APHY|nr:hypothetical protein OBBRIDRAFT_405793 [Obba rivulosa]
MIVFLRNAGQGRDQSLHPTGDVLVPMLSSITTLLMQGWLDWPTFTQRILYFASLFITHLLRRPIPPSPRLNFDVLNCIFRELPTQDLHAAALVCRQWAWAAQAPLYADLFLDTHLPNAPLLSRTMTTCPHLRPLVRSLTVTIGIDTRDTTLVDWLQLLPANSAREFKIQQLVYEEDFATFILQSPFLRSIRRLECEGVFLRNGEHLERCFTLPQVRHVSLYVSHHVDDVNAISVPPALTCLSLALFHYRPMPVRLLTAVGRQLERLDLDLGHAMLDTDQMNELLHALEKYTHRLRHLTIRALARPETPYLDSIGRLIPSLEYLHLGIASFGPALFDHLPPNLCTLRLEDDYRWDFPLDELEEFILRVGRGESQCRSIMIFFVGYNLCDMSPYMDLAEVCGRCGVEFQFLDWLRISQWWDD